MIKFNLKAFNSDKINICNQKGQESSLTSLALKQQNVINELLEKGFVVHIILKKEVKL